MTKSQARSSKSGTNSKCKMRSAKSEMQTAKCEVQDACGVQVWTKQVGEEEERHGQENGADLRKQF